MNQKALSFRGKRAFDLVTLALSAPITVPVGLLAAAAVFISAGTPVLFKQERAGLHGRTFHVFKFRTMNNKRDDFGNLLPDRERITRVGTILRKTSLDELPQLLNILRGEMSIVGPRPLYPRYVEHYTSRERTRLKALPGITGLAQVSGRNSAGWRERLELDAQYAENMKFMNDLTICFLTAMRVVRSDGVSVIAGDTGDPLDIERSYPARGQLHLRRLYPRDLPLRVRWMSDQRIREHMNLPENPTLQETQDWYARNLRDPNRHEFAIEDESGKVLAMTGLRAARENGPSEFYIFVDPEKHGKGVGRIATELTIEQARRLATVPSVTLTVSRLNGRAVHIYRDIGFKEVESSGSRMRMELNIWSEL